MRGLGVVSLGIKVEVEPDSVETLRHGLVIHHLCASRDMQPVISCEAVGRDANRRIAVHVKVAADGGRNAGTKANAKHRNDEHRLFHCSV